MFRFRSPCSGSTFESAVVINRSWSISASHLPSYHWVGPINCHTWISNQGVAISAGSKMCLFYVPVCHALIRVTANVQGVFCVMEGLMAYVGSDQAITQLEAGKASFSLAGYLSFLLWRSVYITKQVRKFTG